MTRIEEDDDQWAIPEVGDTVTVDEGLADEAGIITWLGEDELHEGIWPVRILWKSGVKAEGTVYWDGLWLFISDVAI